MLRLAALRGRHLYHSSSHCHPLITRHQTTPLQGIRQRFAATRPVHGLDQFTSFSSGGGGRAFLGTASASSGGFLAWYLRMLDKHPLATKSLTAAQFFALSDMTSQGLAGWMAKEGEAKEDWDKIRTLRMLGIGMCLSAPALHVWFNFMSWAIPKTDIVNVLKKVLLGQALFAPIFNCAFFSVNSFSQGENGQQALKRIKRDLIPTWQSGILYWPILDFITFSYLPVRLQVFFNNCCSFIWTIYLTSMAGKKAVAPAESRLSA